MKIGIVSDIHAYIEPLQQALALFKAKGVSQILCAGDLIDGGWEDEAVIDTIRSQNVISVRGNHDREAASEPIELWNSEEDIDSDLLISYQSQYLNALPESREFHWEGLTVYVTHGAPWSDTFHVFPSASEDTCKRIFEITQADIVILGHTHIPMKLKYQDKWIFNSGAVAGNRDNMMRTCGILQLPEAKFELFNIETQQSVQLDTTIISD